ncbi:MAG: bifunctional DNA-formamidopyrimidine glycosylase/DNA-(apurinic or apyrimidinic site) lyase [Candidatus Doudnabacteria bacterium]|nr:bifunctional DNA-formamidopyrimidine glycosylase/DNA-(apurinic or apyrimidinic site) lyase [Candidatus Doudnabacteria bacterium]
MPELPEVETIKRGLQRTIVGKTIQSVEVRLPKIISLGPLTVSNIRKNSRAKAAKFEKVLGGRKIVGIKRRAKMLMIKFVPPQAWGGIKGEVEPRSKQQPLSNSPLARGERGTWWLLVHLKMTGQFIFVKKGQRKIMKIFNVVGSRRLELPHQYTHVIFHFTDGSTLYYNDLRQFGYLRLVRDSEIDQVRELKEFGPEPLSRDYTYGCFAAKARTRPRLTVKQFIMDPKVVAGVGNIYSDEIMYCARVRPMRKVKSLQAAELKKLYNCVPKILKEALRYHGSSVGDYFRVDGSEGTYGKRHRVYGRGGQKCRRCGTIIKTVKLGGRTGSYCPNCQK